MISRRQLELLTEIRRWDTRFHEPGCRPGFPSFEEESPQQCPAQERTSPSGLTRTKFRAQPLPRTAVSLQQMTTGSLHPAVISSFYLSLENQFNLNPASVFCFVFSCLIRFGMKRQPATHAVLISNPFLKR